MIRLHYSNRLEALIDPLARAVVTEQRANPLEPVQIIVPNRAIEQFIKFHLAQEIGIAANLRFPFLRTFLGRLIEDAFAAARVLETEQLQIVIFEILRAADARADSALKPAIDYIRAGAGSTADTEARAIELSGRIAALFREYSISRERMLDSWRRGNDHTAKGFQEAAEWQCELWRMIFDDDRCVRQRFASSPEVRWMLLPDAFAAVDPARLHRAVRRPIHIFGLAYVGTAFARIFERLARVTDVAIYALNPCLEFWEDLDTSRRALALDWAHRNARLGSAIEESEDPFELQKSDTLALQYWGRPGREYVRLLNELTECAFESHFVEDNGDSLLHRVQSDILNRRPQGEALEPGAGLAADDSVRFLACPSIPREVEIVANKIWSLVKNDESKRSGGGLRFHEIAVVVPEVSRDLYLPHIEAVFQRLHKIPFEVVSRSYASRSRIAEAIELILDLPLGRFTRDQMLRLMTHPAIVGRGDDIDNKRWPAWARALGIYLGADDSDLENTYIRGLYHWDQALKRLALGIFMEGRSGEAQFFDAGGERLLLPLDLPQEEIGSVAAMLRIARGLIADAIRIRTARMTLRNWSRLLLEIIATYIPRAGVEEEGIRSRLADAIDSIGLDEFEIGPVSYEVVRSLVRDRVSRAESEEGRFNARGLAVGPLSALQSIPFKVIFAIGLSEGVVPERDRRDPLDLRGARRDAGDVTPAERDRYLFLQTILAARDKLFLSYLARDPQTGDPLEPSSLIREFREILRSYLDFKTLQTLTISHRVSKHDAEYFPDLVARGETPLSREGESFDPEARRGARMAALRRDLAAHAIGNSLPVRAESLLARLAPDVHERMRQHLRLIELPSRVSSSKANGDEIRIPISALRQFLECPLQGAARYVLGMEENESDEVGEDEPLELSRLDRAVLLREVFWKTKCDPEITPAEYERRFRIAQMQGRAPAGPFGKAATESDLARLKRWREQLSIAGIDSLDEWQEIRLGPAEEFGRASTILPPITLEVILKRPDGAKVKQPVYLYGSLGRFSSGRDASIQGILRKESKPRDFVAMALGAIVLAAAGEAMPSRVRAIALCGPPANKGSVRILAIPSRETALAYLATIVSDLLAGEDFHFFPIEAAALCFNARRSDDLQQAIIDQVRDRPFSTCASDYGPVRNARGRFEPPSDERIAEILARRYGLINAIFDKDSAP